VLHLEHSFVWCWNVDTLESGSEISGKFLNVVLEKNGEDQLDRTCEKWRSITQSEGGEEYRNTIKGRKANWIGHILCRNCLLKHAIEGKLEGRIEMTRRRGRRRKQLLDDLKEKRIYWKLKEDALDCTLWRARFGRGYGPVVRQTTEWNNEWTYHFAVALSYTWKHIKKSRQLVISMRLCMKLDWVIVL
jgi:hypothetical protein